MTQTDKDIVERLREIERAVRPGMQPLYLHVLCGDAADEIERLRSNTGCARAQQSTQFCAEVLTAQREIERMRAQMFENLEVARAAIERLTAEAKAAEDKGFRRGRESQRNTEVQ